MTYFRRREGRRSGGMSAVVQATCPGCKKVLRIPADWLNQTFRCKYCRTVIQARPHDASGRLAPAPPPSGAPARADHGVQKPPAERRARPDLPVAQVSAAVAPPVVPVAV